MFYPTYVQLVSTWNCLEVLMENEFLKVLSELQIFFITK